MKTDLVRIAALGVLWTVGMLLPRPAQAHCDTMNDPVVLAAKAALESQEVTPIRAFVHCVEGLQQAAGGGGAQAAEGLPAFTAPTAPVEQAAPHHH